VTRRDAIGAAVVAAVVLALYVATLRPDVGGTEDSPKFQLVGHVLGTAHSPGYPLYVVLTHLFTRVPLGILAWRVNLFSAVCGALACALAFLIARRLGSPRLLAGAAALAAATTSGVWRNAIVAEVYTLAALTAAFTVWLLLTWEPERGRSRLYAACAAFAAGLGNHLTIVGLLPAALAYGIARDRSVLRARVVAVALLIGIAGVLQYGFIALRTVQRAPYLEAQANSVRGIVDVMLARDQSWARFQHGAGELVAVQLPALANALLYEIGTAPLAFALLAVAVAVVRRQPDVLLVTGGALGMLALVLNLSGDVSGFLVPVTILVWPLAAAGLQFALDAASSRAGANFSSPEGPRRRLALAAGLLAFVVPISKATVIRHAVEPLRNTEDVSGLRAMYGRLPPNAVVVADNYWTARVLDYLHLSGEYAPDPAPTLAGREFEPVRRALAGGRPVFVVDGARAALTLPGEWWFEPTRMSARPFDEWIQRQPEGTHILIAAAGRPLPFEWLPATNRVQSGRPSGFGVVRWLVGDAEAGVVQDDTRATLEGLMRGGRLLHLVADEDGAVVAWGDDVISSLDRGVALVAIAPDGTITGRWTFDAREPLEMPLAPLVFAVRPGRQPPAGLPSSGELDVSAVNDAIFGDGWYPAERARTQRFRWAQQASVMRLPIDDPKPLQLILHLRAANRAGATVSASISGLSIGSCALPGGSWADCRIEVPAQSLHRGTNELTLRSDSVIAREDRGADPRELALAMQTSRWR
jgi:hypothetical protein